MSEEDNNTKIILEPSPVHNDLIMKKKSKDSERVIRKLSFNENPPIDNKNDEEQIKKELSPLEKLPNPVAPTTDTLPPLRKVRGPYSPPPLLDVSEKTLSNRNNENNNEDSEDAMTPTSPPHLDASLFSSSFNQNDIHLIPIPYCQKLSKLSHIICPLKSSIMAYELQHKDDKLPSYILAKKELLKRYELLIEKSRRLFSQNISHYFYQIEKKLIDIFNQCPNISNEIELFETFKDLYKLNKDIRSFYRDIWYCSKIILSSPPNITVMIQRLHFYIRLDLESIIIRMRSYNNYNNIQFSYNDNIMSEYLLFINDLFQLQSEYPCAIGKMTCSLCNNALKQPYIIDKLSSFDSKIFIENPPKSLCVFELLNDRYKCLINKKTFFSSEEEKENENIIMKFISSISSFINQCILHFIYTENGYNNFHHCNKRFYDINNDDEIDYKELLVNYYYIVLRKEYNRILPPTITDFSIIDWQIAMGKFQQFWRKTREWKLDNIQYSIKCLSTALKKISSLISDPNTCLMLSNTSLHIFRHFNNQLIRIYQHESLIVMCNVLLSMIELSKLCDKIVNNINTSSYSDNNHIINDIKEIFIHNKWSIEVYIGELTEKIRIKNSEMISHILDNTMKQKSYILKTTPLNMSMWISQVIYQGLTSISPILSKKYSLTRNYLVCLLIDSTLQLLSNYLKKKHVKINRFGALQLFIDIHSIIEWGYTYKYTKGTDLNSFKRLEAIIDLYLMNPRDLDKTPLTDADSFMENKSFKYQDEFIKEYPQFPDILRTLTQKNLPYIDEMICSKTEKKSKQKQK